MAMKLKILCFGPDRECLPVVEVLNKLEHLSGCSKEFVFLEDLEQLEKSLVE